MTTFLCPSCRVRTEWDAGVEVPMMGGGVGAHLRMCEECASCAWCDEPFRRSHPAHDREHNTKSGRNSAAFVCLHCYALDVHNMTAVVQNDPDGTIRFSYRPDYGGAQ